MRQVMEPAMGLDFNDFWMQVARPALVSGAGAVVASTAQQALQLEPVKQEVATIATQKSAEGIVKYLDWMKANPGRAAAYGAGALAVIMGIGILAYRGVKGR